MTNKKFVQKNCHNGDSKRSTKASIENQSTKEAIKDCKQLQQHPQMMTVPPSPASSPPCFFYRMNNETMASQDYVEVVHTAIPLLFHEHLHISKNAKEDDDDEKDKEDGPTAIRSPKKEEREGQLQQAALVHKDNHDEKQEQRFHFLSYDHHQQQDDENFHYLLFLFLGCLCGLFVTGITYGSLRLLQYLHENDKKNDILIGVGTTSAHHYETTNDTIIYSSSFWNYLLSMMKQILFTSLYILSHIGDIFYISIYSLFAWILTSNGSHRAQKMIYKIISMFTLTSTAITSAAFDINTNSATTTNNQEQEEKDHSGNTTLGDEDNYFVRPPNRRMVFVIAVFFEGGFLFGGSIMSILVEHMLGLPLSLLEFVSTFTLEVLVCCLLIGCYDCGTVVSSHDDVDEECDEGDYYYYYDDNDDDDKEDEFCDYYYHSKQDEERKANSTISQHKHLDDKDADYVAMV